MYPSDHAPTNARQSTSIHSHQTWTDIIWGLDIYDLRTDVGIESIKYMRNAIYSDSAAGRLILTNLHYYSQLESGQVNPILEHPQMCISYFTPTWMTSLRRYLSNHNITITVSDHGCTKLTSPMDQQIIMQPQHLPVHH